MNTTPIFAVRTGRVLGRDHLVRRRSCQDASVVGSACGWCWGVVSDGCGQGSASELGALLTTHVVSHHLEAGLPSLFVDAGDAVARLEESAVASLVQSVAAAVVDALGAVAARVAVRESSAHRAFVHEHLLATALGYALSDTCGFAFAFGDGLLLVDDEVEAFEQDDRPLYLGYALLGRSIEPVVRVFGRATRVAVATDGFDASTLRTVATSERAPRRVMLALQRDGAFDDDGAIALAIRCDVVPAVGRLEHDDDPVDDACAAVDGPEGAA